MEIESVEIKAETKKLTGNFTVEVGHGWPVYRDIDGLPDRQRLDDRHWPRNGTLSHHKPIVGYDELKPGMRVIWKGSIYDYVWCDGIIVERGGILYVEEPNTPGWWGSPFTSQKDGCWLTDGVCYAPNIPVEFMK